MSVTVDDEVLDAQTHKTKPTRVLVKYKKRRWDIDTADFALDAAYTSLLRSEIAKVPSIRESLDRKAVNQFETSNVTIELHNPLNKWDPRNSAGLLAPDATAKLGYILEAMEFAVEFYYELEDGTESSAIPMFTGRVANYDFRPDADIIAITVESPGVLLKRANAENVSTSVTGETPIGLIDGLNTTFITANDGVGRFGDIRLDGAVQRPGIEITISNLNDANLPATMEFAAAPGGGSTLTVDYIYWLQDQKIDALVKLLAVEAGIPLTQQDVEGVVYQNQVINTQTYTSQADWQGGLTVQNLDTITTAGQITRLWHLIDNFANLNYTTDPTWTKTGAAGVSAASGSLVITAGTGTSAFLETPFTNAYGSWNADINSSLAGGVSVTTVWGIIGTGAAGARIGYALVFAHFSNQVILYRRDPATTSIINCGAIPAGSNNWRITRDPSGNFEVFKNGVSCGVALDNTHKTSAHTEMAAGSTGAGGTLTATFDNLYYSTGVDSGISTVADTTAIWGSNGIDGTVDLGAFLTVLSADSLPAGTSVLLETATSDDDITYDAYVAIGAAGQVNSTQRRYLRVRATFTTVGLPTFATPIVFDIRVVYTTATTTIKLANFTGWSCNTAIAELGKTANYEWGFSRTGRLFFRPRTFSETPVLTIEKKDIKVFSRISDGIARVYNRIVGNYGSYEKITDPLTRNDPSPNSFDLYGVRSLSVGSTQLLVGPDADIATGLSIGYYQEFKLPRREIEMTIDFRPQLEMADTIRLMVRDNLPDPPWYVGDTSQYVGKPGLYLYGAKQQAAYNVLYRILSLRNDAFAKETALTLEEVL